jgi:diadenylate cyclase
LTIFQNGSALHDGAVIIRNGKIAAAGCFLPLSTRPSLSSKLGTRHRAAIGVTEETDCLALIVSEETGRISVAAFGEIEFDVSSERLRERMLRHLQQKVDAPAEHPIAIATTETFVRAQTSDGAD